MRSPLLKRTLFKFLTAKLISKLPSPTTTNPIPTIEASSYANLQISSPLRLSLSKKIVHILDSKKNANSIGTKRQVTEIWAFSRQEEHGEQDFIPVHKTHFSRPEKFVIYWILAVK
jgi:hypothetical protein